MKKNYIITILITLTLFACSSHKEPLTKQTTKTINTNNGTNQIQTTHNAKVVVAKHKITASQSN